MKTLDEQIKDQQDLVVTLAYHLAGIHDSYIDIANQLDRVTTKHETELKHLRNLIAYKQKENT